MLTPENVRQLQTADAIIGSFEIGIQTNPHLPPEEIEKLISACQTVRAYVRVLTHPSETEAVN